MKQLYLLIALISVCQFTFAQSNDELLRQLDETIALKSTYQAQRFATADSLTRRARTQVGQERIVTLRNLYSTYLHFRTDSALSTLSALKALPEYQTDISLRQQIQLDEAQVFGMIGLYSVAFSMMQEVDRSQMDSATLLIYYNTRHAVLGWMAEYAEKTVPHLAGNLKQQAIAYHDSLLTLEPDPMNRSIIHSNFDYDRGLYESSLDTLLSVFSQCDLNRRIYVYSNLSQVYHQLHNEEEELHYLILTAISDIRAGVSEYMALPLLAFMLNSRGDVDRAYSYLYCALEDANLSKASLRTMEVREFFPIIHESRQIQLSQQRKYIIVIISLLTLVAGILTIIVLRMNHMNRKLKATRELLAEANDNLLRNNQKLQLADRQKSEYLKSYLTRSRDYLSSSESFQKQMLNLIQTHQYDEMLKQLKSNRQGAEEGRFLNDFDMLFLNLYPDFVEKFNKLLKPEEQILPKKGELLTTELRIFALIRMGETDSARIAKFLNYSLTTIYNYRSRTRNNAIGDKEKFEEAVMTL